MSISRLLSINFFFIYLCAMQMEFTFIKREKMPWMKYGLQMITRDNSTVRAFRDYEVVANEPLSSQVHLLVVRAKDFLQIIHPGRHVVVKLNEFGEYHSFSLFSSIRSARFWFISFDWLVNLKNLILYYTIIIIIYII